MRTSPLTPLPLLLASLLALATACGGDDSGTGDTTTTSVGATTETSTTESDGSGTTETTDGEFAEFCTGQQDLIGDAMTLLLTGPDGPPDFQQFRDRQAALVDAAPPELVDELEAIATYDFETNGPEGFRRDLGEQSAAVSAYLDASCEPLALPDQPTFEIDHAEGTGQQSVYFVRGTCSDGSFPTDVTGPSGLFQAGPATDLGDGLYSFALPLKDGVDPLAEAVLLETMIPDTVNGTCP